MEQREPTHNEMMKIAVESCLCLKTVKTVYMGGGHHNSIERVMQSAKKLKLPLPGKVS